MFRRNVRRSNYIWVDRIWLVWLSLMLSRATRLGTTSMCPHTLCSTCWKTSVCNFHQLPLDVSVYQQPYPNPYTRTESTLRALCRRMRIRKICKCLFDGGRYCCSYIVQNVQWSAWARSYKCERRCFIGHLLARHCFGFWSTSMCSMLMNSWLQRHRRRHASRSFTLQEIQTGFSTLAQFSFLTRFLVKFA